MRELVDISKSLTGFQIPYWLGEIEEHLRSEGIRFDYCSGIYQSKLLTFIQDNFWIDWYRKNKASMEKNDDPKVRILAIEANEVVGFINFVVLQNEGRIRQTGVIPRLRNRKLVLFWYIRLSGR